MYSLENHRSSFNSDHHHQRHQNDTLSNTLKSSSSFSSTSCIAYDDDNDLDEVRIFLNKNEHDVTDDQDATSYELSEELSTKALRRNSSLSLSSLSSSCSVLSKSFHRSIQSTSLRTSTPCRDINFTNNKIDTYPHPTKQIPSRRVVSTQSHRQQSKENLIPKSNHGEQHRTKNYHTDSIKQIPKESLTGNQMKNYHLNNHNSILAENPTRIEQLGCNTSSQEVFNKKLQRNQTNSKRDKQIKRYKLQNKRLGFDKESKTDYMNTQYCSMDNSKTCAKKDFSSTYTTNGNKNLQEKTTDLSLMTNSTLSRPATSNSICQMYHHKKSNSLRSNDHQFIRVLSSDKDRRAIIKAENEKRQAIKQIQLLASEEALILARQKALERRQTKLIEIHKNLQLKHKQAEIRRKAIEASKQERFNQLSKQSQDYDRQKSISNRQQHQKPSNRLSSCRSNLLLNYRKMNNNSIKVSSLKDTNESMITSSVTTITTINRNTVTATIKCPFGFGSSTPRFVCYTSKELMHFKYPSVIKANNSNRVNSQFCNYGDRIISSSRQNSYTKQSFIKSEYYYYTNKRLVKSAHQNTTNHINNTNDKLHYQNWQSLSLYLDCDSINTRTSIGSDQSIIPTEQPGGKVLLSSKNKHRIHKTTTNGIDSNVDSRKLNCSSQSSSKSPSFITKKKSLQKSTNSPGLMRFTKRSSIQSLTSIILSSSTFNSSKQSLPVKQSCEVLQQNLNKYNCFESGNINNTKHTIVHCQTVNSHKLLDTSKRNLKQMNPSDVHSLNKSFIDHRKANSNIDMKVDQSENVRIERKNDEKLPIITTTTQGNVQKTSIDSWNSLPAFQDHQKIVDLIIEEILQNITDQNISKTTDEQFMETDQNEAKTVKHQMESLGLMSTTEVESSVLSLNSSLSTASEASFSLLSNMTTTNGTLTDTLVFTTSVMQMSPITTTHSTNLINTSLCNNSLTVLNELMSKTLQFNHSTKSIINKIDKSIINEQSIINKINNIQLQENINHIQLINNNNDNQIQIKNNYQSNLMNIREKPIQIVYPFHSTNLSQSGRLIISLSAELAEREARKKRLEGIMSRIKLHSNDDYNQTINNESSMDKLTNTVQDIGEIYPYSKLQQVTTSVLNHITVPPLVLNSLTHSSQEGKCISTSCILPNNINPDKKDHLPESTDELTFHDENDHNNDPDEQEYENKPIQLDSNNDDTIRNRASIIANMLASGRLDRNSRAAEVLITMISKNQSDLNKNKYIENIHKADEVIPD
uniref:Tcp10_C domain-containing protein n=1 Tax=Schistosoma mansoni TaxID=6183 RepID=A0A5K4FCD8_SCHMA